MKSTNRKSFLFLAILLIIALASQPLYVLAEEDASHLEQFSCIQLDVMESVKESSQSLNRDLKQIHELTISGQEQYSLTNEDFEYIKKTYVQLKKLDIREVAFKTKEVCDLFVDYYNSMENFEFKYNEQAENLEEKGDTIEEQPEEKEQMSDGSNTITQESNENIDNSDTGITAILEGDYNLTLQGICRIDKGSQIDVGVAYQTNDPDIQFCWKEYDLSAGKWSLISDWSNGNWTTWKPKKAGDYWIYVESKTSDGKTASSVMGYHYKGVSVTLSGICLLDRGTKYDMGVAYNTNDAEIRFRWKIYDLKEKVWTVLQKESKGNWTSWSPKKAGDYWIHVEAITGDGKTTAYTMGFRFGGLKTDLNGICVLPKDDVVQAGVAYSTNDAGLMFRWLVYNLAQQKWIEINNWSKGNWVSWKPTKQGDYWLYVEAKTSDGKILSQVCGYHVNGAKITGLVATPESPNWVGANIELKGKVQDPASEIASDRYLVYDGQTWQEIPKGENSAIWVPSALGSYLLCYEVYDEAHSLIAQKFKGYSIEMPYVNFNGIYIRNDGDMTYGMAVNADTNDKNIIYRWLYYDLAISQWHEMRGWSGSNAVSWKAPRAGSYWIHVEVRLSDGTTKSYTVGHSVRRYQNPSGYYQIQDKITLSGGDYNLFYGFEGLKVMYVMRALGVGYGIGMNGAFYGNDVVLTVKAFQQRKGLPVNGIVDYNTWIAMGLPWQDWFNLGAYVSPIKVNANSTRSDCIEAMISTAYSYLGDPYVIGASGAPGLGIDCSGLVMQALYSAGLDLSPINPVRHAYPGYEYESRNMWSSPYFKHVSYGERQRGDLIFYQSSNGTVIHVAIYLGNDQVIESWPNQVVVWPIKNSHRSNIKGVVRPFV